jgi:hypothetical protein
MHIIAVYPSWDRFVFMVHPRTGIRSLADIKAKRYPLHPGAERWYRTHVLINK